MQVLTSWKWGKKIIPEEERRRARHIIKVQKISLLNKDLDLSRWCHNDVVLLTGDGLTLPTDVKQFESWGIPHDVFCCNRSPLFFEREINHWGAVDAEESAWLSQYHKLENGRFLRHVIGFCQGYDAYWFIDQPVDSEFGRRMWAGNSGYFGMMASLAMGYKKVVIAGMPLDRNRHWYDTEGTEGPHWVPDTYTIWMDYKIERPEAAKVRSLSGYSKFIMGEATKEWVLT